MSLLKQSIFINAPLEKVFAYATNPKDWSNWYAHLTGPEKLSGNGEAGTVGEFKYILVGQHLPMTIEVKEKSQTADHAIWRGTFDGLLHGVQLFAYQAKDGGTDLTVDIEYSVPGNIFGKIMDLVLIEKLQTNSTTHTLENLKAICESFEPG